MIKCEMCTLIWKDGTKNWSVYIFSFSSSKYNGEEMDPSVLTSTKKHKNGT